MAVRVDTTRRKTKTVALSSRCKGGKHGACAALRCNCPCHYFPVTEAVK